MNSAASKVLIAYVAAPHRGYLNLFRKYAGGTLWVLGRDLIEEFQPLVRNLPAPEPEENATMIRALGIFADVRILTKEILQSGTFSSRVVMPDEDVSRAVAAKYFADAAVTFDSTWRLRWDWGATTANRRPEVETTISRAEFDRLLMADALGIAQKSPDWWRQIGALLVRDGELLLAAFNTHMPSEQSAYLMGDPRSNFEAGQHIDASLALHGEAGVIAEAARRGLRTEGCDMYVTTFPCPPCANHIAGAGIKRLFYLTGYSLVAGADSLVSRGVKIVRVEMEPAPALT
jgi:dCMP deaminase